MKWSPEVYGARRMSRPKDTANDNLALAQGIRHPRGVRSDGVGLRHDQLSPGFTTSRGRGPRSDRADRGHTSRGAAFRLRRRNPGLGTAGPHPYLVGLSEARAVLDSVRAAREIAGAGASDRFAVWGHSQGGQAALFSGLIADTYAPELRLAGVAAAVPASGHRQLKRTLG